MQTSASSVGLNGKTHLFGVFFDRGEKEVFCDGAGGGASVVALAGVSALDHDGYSNFRILNGGKADEPGEVDFFTMGAEISCSGFTGDAEAGDADEPSGASRANDAFHSFPEKGLVGFIEANGFSAVIDLPG